MARERDPGLPDSAGLGDALSAFFQGGGTFGDTDVSSDELTSPKQKYAEQEPFASLEGYIMGFLMESAAATRDMDIRQRGRLTHDMFLPWKEAIKNHLQHDTRNADHVKALQDLEAITLKDMAQHAAKRFQDALRDKTDAIGTIDYDATSLLADMWSQIDLDQFTKEAADLDDKID